MFTAIVLDGNLKASLAVTRSLGKHGINVIVGSETESSLSSRSKWCSGSLVYPNPNSDTEFVESVRKEAALRAPAVLIPVTDVSLNEILKQRNLFGPEVIIPFPDFETYRRASDKAFLFRSAAESRIPIPATRFSSDYDDIETMLADAGTLGFPLVIKPALSKVRTSRGWISASVRYARDAQELRQLLQDEVFRDFPFIIQERVEGAGIGIFLLMDHGKVVAKFAHRRLREKPPSGGVSVLCESVVPHPVALEGAVKLLQSLNWHGVAMVEMKEDRRDGIPKLIEINARFWGSLQLAVSSGVDFPYLLFCLATGTPFEPNPEYAVGRRLRWELGDLDHLLIRMRNRGSDLVLPAGSPSKPRLLGQFIADCFNPAVRNEVFRFDDPSPFGWEIKQYVKDLFR